MKQLTLYIHIPFCNTKCKYCAFYTLPKQNTRFNDYFQALHKEIELVAGFSLDKVVNTIFIGGGTPSLVNPAHLATVLEKIRKVFQLDSCVEITLEANPESLEPSKLAKYKAMGINRISIGLQAWQNNLLKYLGRSYQNKDFIKRFKQVTNAGFDNVNMDLIFGIPGQSLPDWQESVEKVINLAPKHVSCYSLELDNTSFFGTLYKQGKLKPLHDTIDRRMYRLSQQQLQRAGYVQYEISNFAKPGFECRHNLLFWEGADYLGLGAAAHSRVDGVHFHNVENLSDYISDVNNNTLAHKNIEHLTENDLIKELLILNFRLLKGIDLSKFAKQFGFDIRSLYRDEISLLQQNSLITVSGKWLKLTRQGQDKESSVIQYFL